MPRKTDPIVNVLNFFETASIEAAGMALALVKAVVKRRTPAVAKVVRRRRVQKVAEVEAGGVKLPAVLTQERPVLKPLATAPRRRMRAAPSTLELVDVALPGIGPAVIGE